MSVYELYNFNVNYRNGIKYIFLLKWLNSERNFLKQSYSIKIKM